MEPKEIDYNSITDSIFPILVPDKLHKQRKSKDKIEIPSPGFDSPVKEENPDQEVF